MTYVFSFEASEAQLIVDALGKLPYNQVSQLIAKVYEQVRGQAKSTTSNVISEQSKTEQPVERSDGM